MRQARPRMAAAVLSLAGLLATAGVGLARTAGQVILPPAATQTAASDLPDLLRRIGEQVRNYYDRFRTIVCTELVVQTRLQRNFAPLVPQRRFTFDLRLEPGPAEHGSGADFRAFRQVRLIDGRPVEPGATPACMDPAESFTEHLAFLLDEKRGAYAFGRAGHGKMEGVAVEIIEFSPLNPEPPQVSWEDNCFKLSAEGHAKGRIWVDAATFEVLRVDSRLVKPLVFEVPAKQQRAGAAPRLRLDRSETSVRYQRVTFPDPDEVVLLPVSIETLTVLEGAAVPRLRTRQSFTDYRRFLTDAHVRP